MSGGERRSSATASASAFGSAYSGICSAFLERHESGVHTVLDGAGGDATARTARRGARPARRTPEGRLASDTCAMVAIAIVRRLTRTGKRREAAPA